jgi:hypothetical protein
MLPTQCSFRLSHRDDKVDTASFNTNSERSSRNGGLMGVMTRKLGESFIITSDRIPGELPTSQAPKKRVSDAHQFWTGDGWSATVTDARIFAAIDIADDYLRANYAQVMGPMGKR